MLANCKITAVLQFVLLVAGALLIQAAPAFGDPITWTLEGVQYYAVGPNPGGVVSGSFTYDADTNTVTNIDIVVTPGIAFTANSVGDVTETWTPETIFTATAPAFNLDPTEFIFVPGVLTYGVPEPALGLDPSSGLTDAGGTVSVTGAFGGAICSMACDGINGGIGIYTGDLTTAVAPPPVAATPEPTSLLLLGSGLLTFLLWRRRPGTSSGAAI